MRYPVAKPDLSGNELAYVTDCLNSTWISSTGRYLAEFESRFAQSHAVANAIATCNGTVALHLALAALGVQPGDEVIVPTLTYIATANAVTYCGAAAVFADCEPDTWCISIDSIERLINKRTKGIIPVHLYGHPCEMQHLLELANRYGLWVVEDCAEALGATFANRPVGSTATMGVFSFFGNKIITTGEGGMVTTQDSALANRLRLLRGQGMDPNRRYWHPVVGFNYRMTNVAAAIGLAQVERLDQLIADRKRIAGWYARRLVRSPAITLPIQKPPAENVFWLYSILIDAADQRDRAMLELAKKGIETRPFFYPVHQFPMYVNHRADRGCPIASGIAARGISLPTSSYLAEADVEAIAHAVCETVATVHSPVRKVA